MPLPAGITFLLEVATGEVSALNSAHMMTTLSQTALQTAAAFFIEQVLFSQTADSYRVLGASRAAPRRELRRHMALLVKWLHADSQDPNVNRFDVDRSIFVYRVTRAWEDLKYDQRRAAYDRTLKNRPNGIVRWREAHCWALEPAKGITALVAYNVMRRQRSRRLVMYRIGGDTLFGRLLYYLGGHA
jgi:hypothetical protein